MTTIMYSDFEGIYKLIDYNPSHSQLLLRKRERKEHFNIDIVFKSIQYISIPIEMNGIEISIINVKSEIDLIKEKFSFTTDFGYKIYSIRTSKEELFFLNASVFGVFKNDLDILESSLGDFTWSEGNKLIYWSGDTPTGASVPL